MVEVQKGSQDSNKPEVHAKIPTPQYPDPNAPKVEKTVGSLATLSSNVDPSTHAVMSAVCAFGAGYAYQFMKQPKTAALVAGISAAYAGSTYMLHQGQTQMGYWIGSVASIGLLALTGPKAYAHKDPFNVGFASFGALGTVANTLKAYQQRTGRPREYNMQK
ncbi:9572_t:CDS:2 [Ambispora gerdemannii]|uniref:9572_t:CDS:1 n=1 Tax=Ambispora gerdemannii TaxID=144530 RepID=A0A9N9EW93_9GLOM|nr:9572_t:CDS:2 [Ambispora gerdemannii]